MLSKMLRDIKQVGKFYDQNALDNTDRNKIKQVSLSQDFSVPLIYQWALWTPKRRDVEHSISCTHFITESVFQESRSTTFRKADLAVSEKKNNSKKDATIFCEQAVLSVSHELGTSSFTSGLCSHTSRMTFPWALHLKCKE